MALAAQERGEDLADVIGSDYKAFCDEIVSQGTRKTKWEYVKEAIFIIANGGAVLLLIHLLFMTSTTIAAAWLITYWIGKRSFQLSSPLAKKPYLVQFLWGAAFGITTVAWLILVISLKSVVLFSVHLFVVIGMIIVLSLIGRWSR
ncbi:hypothetical protein [Paenibacillus xylaniclasticus]|uniref:hypothetical protein n=1 Tax=Paenibacillus xylaniclasticus TaxID=588083 RepID=UPI000FD7F6BE|nr:MULTISPECIES: hypothetical protein [Paenibacillus]GFN32928.1 hypothetical protein PCURB6_31880 [Paenibacillus curdlanolyticus]